MKTQWLCGTLFLAACVNPPIASTMQAEEVTNGTVRALTSVSGDRTGISYGLGEPPDEGMPQTLRLTSMPFAGLIRQYDFPQVSGTLSLGLTNYPPDTDRPSRFDMRLDDLEGPLARVAGEPPDDNHPTGSLTIESLGARLSSILEYVPCIKTFRFAAGAAGRSPLVTVAANPPDDGHPDGSLTTQIGEGRIRATTVAIPAGPPLITVGIPAGPPLITVAIPAGPPLVPVAGEPPDDNIVAFDMDGANHKIVGTATLVDGGRARLDFQVLDAEGRVVFDSAAGQ